jgi:hypothetical protein
MSKRVLPWFALVLILLLATWLVFRLLPPTAFRDNFIGNFGATLLGVIVGIPVALSINASQAKQEEQRRAEDASRERRARATQYLKMVQLSLANSLTFLDYVMAQLAPGRIIYSNLDIEQLESTAALKYEIIDDLAICGNLDLVRYDLRHISRLMDLNLTMSFGAFRAAVGEAAFLAEQKTVVTRIRDFIPDTREAVLHALSMIRSNLSEPSQTTSTHSTMPRVTGRSA